MTQSLALYVSRIMAEIVTDQGNHKILLHICAWMPQEFFNPTKIKKRDVEKERHIEDVNKKSNLRLT